MPDRVRSRVRKGDTVAARVHHNGIRAGTEGKVTGVYNGTYYAVSYPGVTGVCYTPDPQATPVAGSAAGTGSAPAPGGAGTPGPEPPTTSASSEIWERLMSLLPLR